MYVVSPWSKGGWVNSQVFDHTSVGRFLEQRFGIQVDAISPWSRAVCGDLTTCFDFVTPNDPRIPKLPDTSNYPAINAAQNLLPTAPVTQAPAIPQPLFQETGTRFSRALPYELHTSARLGTDGAVELLFSNTGDAGAVFHVYDKRNLDLIPRRYTVEAGKTLSDTWTGGDYDLWVYSTNGFVRTFAGNTQLARADAGSATAAGRAFLREGVQPRQGPPAGRAAGQCLPLGRSLDPDGRTGRGGRAPLVDRGERQLTTSPVTAEGFERRFAGRMEQRPPRGQRSRHGAPSLTAEECAGRARIGVRARAVLDNKRSTLS